MFNAQPTGTVISRRETSNVPKKTAMSPRKRQCPLESRNVPKKAAMSPRKSYVPKKTAMFPVKDFVMQDVHPSSQPNDPASCVAQMDQNIISPQGLQTLFYYQGVHYFSCRITKTNNGQQFSELQPQSTKMKPAIPYFYSTSTVMDLQTHTMFPNLSNQYFFVCYE